MDSDLLEKTEPPPFRKRRKRKGKWDEDIFRTDKTFMESKKQLIRGQRVQYRERAPSARHSGLRPLMIAILSLIHKASQIARSKGMKFYGLTLYECQNALQECGVSNDTVRDNLRKLVKLKLLKKVHHTPKNRKFRYTFYDLNKDTFPCRDGAWIIMDVDGLDVEDEMAKKMVFNTFYVVNCPDYPYCSLDPSKCRMVSHLRKLRNVIDQHLNGLEERIKKFKIDDIDEIYSTNDVSEKKVKKMIKIKKKKAKNDS